MTYLDLAPIRARLQGMCDLVDRSRDHGPIQEAIDASAPLIFTDIPALLSEVERLRASVAADAVARAEA